MFTLDAVQLFDMGFGPHLVPVTPPEAAPISLTSKLTRKSLGKAPGRYTVGGWTGVDLTDARFRCHSYDTAKLWQDWHANVGLVVGDGFAVIDNDQGKEFSDILSEAFRALGMQPLRRYVADPKHLRDAFVFRVNKNVANCNLKFRNGVSEAEIQLLGHDKQAVIFGTHPGTKCSYVWDRRIFKLEEIPLLDEAKLVELLRLIVELGDQQGWQLQGNQNLEGLAAGHKPAVSSVPPNSSSPPQNPKVIQTAIQDASRLLASLPNRDVPPGETSNGIDLWLDDYDNWISVAYALAAHLGPVANTLQAEMLWLEWAFGRAQTQDPEGVWRSVLQQPLKYGPLGLLKLLKGIPGVLPPTGFPGLDPDDPILLTPIWNHIKQTYAHYTPDGRILNTVTGALLPRQSFADLFAPNIGTLLQELQIPSPKKIARQLAADIFMARPDKPVVHGLTYAPGDMRISRDGVFNYWNETTIPRPSVPVPPGQVKVWLDHVDLVLGKDEREQFVKWCAYVAQFPGKKPNWHYIVMSDQGLGKDTMLGPIKLAVGAHNYRNEQVDYLAENQFNDYLKSKLLIISETGQSRNNFVSRRIELRLNQLLASPPETLAVNLKNRDRFWIPNRHAIILFSNEARPLHLDRGQRRLYVINRMGVKRKPEAYYESFNQWLDLNGPLVASYLLTLPLTPAEKRKFSGGTAPDSADKALLEQLSVEAHLDELEQLIADTQAGVGGMAPLATIDEIVSHLSARNPRDRSGLSGQKVRGWLLDMERRKKGVGRVRKDPTHPGGVGVVSRGGKGGRLWHLVPDYKGHAWKDLRDSELIAIWEGQKLPPRRGKALFPDTKDLDEKI